MFADMFIEPGDDPRADPPAQADERATLTGFLRWQRGTLELKCSGLDAAALATRSVDSSTLSLRRILASPGTIPGAGPSRCAGS